MARKFEVLLPIDRKKVHDRFIRSLIPIPDERILTRDIIFCIINDENGTTQIVLFFKKFKCIYFCYYGLSGSVGTNVIGWVGFL